MMNMIKMLDRNYEENGIYINSDCIAELFVSATGTGKEHGVFAVLKDNHPEKDYFADYGVGCVSKHKTREEAYNRMDELATEINGEKS